MSKRSLVWLGILLFAILAVLCILTHAKKIEEKLYNEAKEKLTAAGFGDLSLNFDGRDATISGEVTSKEQKSAIESLLAGIAGVRVVNNQLQLKMPESQMVERPDSLALIAEQKKASEEAEKQRLEKLMKLKQEISRISIHFETNSDKLEASEIAGISQLLRLLEINPDIRIRIIGHADSRGTDDYNEKLGLLRAKAVKNYLLQKGVSGSRLIISSKGESEPVADNSTEEGMAKNRRVQFIVIEEEEK